MAQSESIDSSSTMNWFQELVLGSETFETIYQKQSQLNVESFLIRYDTPKLSRSNAEKILETFDIDEELKKLEAKSLELDTAKVHV